MKKAFTIIRVSSEDQLKGYGPDNQWEDDIVPNAGSLGLEVEEKYRRVIQESATTWERTKYAGAFREAMALHSNGEIQALLFPRVDRETRFIFGSVTLLAEALKTGLDVYFARERLFLDPKDPEAVERYLNKAQQAQSYVETVKVNTMRAKRKMAQQGKLPTGTGKGLYGYKWEKETKKRVAIEFEVMIVQKVFNLYDKGMSRFKIAEMLNAQGITTKAGGFWHPLTIGRMLTNPAYIGVTYFGRRTGSRKTELKWQPKDKWILLPDTTPAIISHDLFERVQQRLKTRKELSEATTHREYLLTGHVVCADCGSPVVGSCLSRHHRYYHCRATQPTAAAPKRCNARYIRADFLEQVVWEKVREVLQKPQTVLEIHHVVEDQATEDNNISIIDEQIAALQRKLKQYPSQEKRLVTLFRYGQVNEDNVLDELNRLKVEWESTEQKLAELEAAKEASGQSFKIEAKITDFCNTVGANIDTFNLKEKRLALDALAIKVRARKDYVEIKGSIPVKLESSKAPENVTTTVRTWA